MLVVWIQVVLKTKECKLRVVGLFGLHNDLHLRSLTANKHCCLLNDEMGLYGGRLKKKRETDVSIHD